MKSKLILALMVLGMGMSSASANNDEYVPLFGPDDRCHPTEPWQHCEREK